MAAKWGQTKYVSSGWMWLSAFGFQLSAFSFQLLAFSEGWNQAGTVCFRNCSADENCYIPGVREIVRKSPRFFLLVLIGGIALRLLFIFRLPAVTADSFVYGDIAKNWLQHGIYGLTGRNEISPTYIRLPGYPAFLALIFAIFGVEHYRAALMLQMIVDIGACFLIADIARRVISPRAAKIAFFLSAFCPFLANYSAAALTETWEIFFTALALDLAIMGLDGSDVRAWMGCGLATGAAVLLRPDGGLLLAGIEVYLGWLFLSRARESSRRDVLKAVVLVVVFAIGPLIPWTVRNLRTFHEFRPLVPRYANEANTFVPRGFERWVKTWIVDYASTEEIYWSVPGSPMDIEQLPTRAFDTEEQRDRTEQLLNDYNHVLQVTPELDRRFAELAKERIHRAALRYYVWLPLTRIADMWLRPRTELLPCNTRWWEFDEQTKWLMLSITLGVINVFYIGAALLGMVRAHTTATLGLLLTFAVVRSAFLGTLENPEPRYTLECYPIVIVLAAAFFQGRVSAIEKNVVSSGKNRRD
jgi:4-amino-4-deoxy-L-arabinose transferase-like glycosyltransferase